MSVVKVNYFHTNSSTKFFHFFEDGSVTKDESKRFAFKKRNPVISVSFGTSHPRDPWMTCPDMFYGCDQSLSTL